MNSWLCNLASSPTVLSLLHPRSLLYSVSTWSAGTLLHSLSTERSCFRIAYDQTPPTLFTLLTFLLFLLLPLLTVVKMYLGYSSNTILGLIQQYLLRLTQLMPMILLLMMIIVNNSIWRRRHHHQWLIICPRDRIWHKLRAIKTTPFDRWFVADGDLNMSLDL